MVAILLRAIDMRWLPWDRHFNLLTFTDFLSQSNESAGACSYCILNWLVPQSMRPNRLQHYDEIVCVELSNKRCCVIGFSINSDFASSCAVQDLIDNIIGCILWWAYEIPNGHWNYASSLGLLIPLGFVNYIIGDDPAPVACTNFIFRHVKCWFRGLVEDCCNL